MTYMKKSLALLLSVLLTLSGLTVGVLAVSPEKAAAPQDGELLLATMSDIHYYPASLAQYKSEAFYDYTRGFNCVYENLDGVIDAAFNAVRRDVTEKGLKYLVLTGDLTTNGEYEGHAALAEKLKALEEETGVRIFVLNGNHDINNPDAAAFTTPDGKKTPARRTSAKEFYDLYYELGFSDAVSTFSAPDTGKAGALSYAAVADNFRFIMIDAGKYTADNTEKKQDLKETGGNITPALLDWVREQADAAKAAGQTPIAFTHWNLSEMNYLHGEILQGFVIDNGYILQETFADMGIHYVFSGHQHVSDIDVTYSDSGEKLVSVITPILTQFPTSFRETAFSVKNGRIDAAFTMLPVDDASPVVSLSGETQASPYRVTGFNKQFGDPTTYLMYMIKGMLQDWVAEIRQSGSIVTFIRDEFGFDLAKKLGEWIPGGLVVGNNEIFTVNNIMALVRDIDSQLVERYINHPENLWAAIEKAVNGLVETQVSDVPCTAYLDTYGFGDETKGGTIGDLFFSIMVLMYTGNEDITNDAFLTDVAAKAGDPAFVDLIFNAALDHVLDGLVMEELLGHVTVNLQALLNGKAPTVADFIRMFYRFVTAIAGEDYSNIHSAQDFFQKLYGVVNSLFRDSRASSFAGLADMILGTGLIPYGKSVREVAENLLAQYIGEKEKRATAEQLSIAMDTIVHDEDLDWDVTYSYTGPEAVTPTLADLQVPNEVTIGVDGDALTFHWLTKYSVTGTALEIVDENRQPLANVTVETETIPDTFTSYGFSFGSFGILPYTRDVNRHRVTVRGLTPGATYYYHVGDPEKNFWTEGRTFTVPETEDFSCLFLNDPVPATAADCAAIAERLGAAVQAEAPAFLLFSGDLVLSGEDDLQFNRLLNAAADVFGAVPVRPVSGKRDLAENFAPLTRHFGVTSSDSYNAGLGGVNYSFDFGAAHFTVLAGEDLDRDGKLSYTQESWARRDLAMNVDKPWRILVIHTDLFGDKEKESLKSYVLHLLSSAEADVLLMGGKAYYRSHPIVNGNPIRLSGVTEVEVHGRIYPAYSREGIGLGFSVPGVGDEFADVTAEEGAYAKTAGVNQPTALRLTVTDHALAFDLLTLDGDGVKADTDAFALIKHEYRRLRGDLDEDGTISAADARLSLRAAVGIEDLSEVQKLVGDVDGDFRLTAADARLILRVAVELETFDPATIVVHASDFGRVR